MPRRKREKTRAETSAEEFFPLDSTDVKYAVEKQYKQPDLQSLTKVEKPGEIVAKKLPKARAPKKKSVKNKTKKTGKTKSEYTQPKVSLKEDGYELIITEKPQAALKIASALGKSVKRDIRGVPYYEVDKQGKRIVVACAVGHLFTLTQVSRGEIPTFDIKWVPNFVTKKNDFSKKYYDVLLKLAKNAGSLTVATDYDIEGEVIGLNVVRFIANQKDASRMKFSTLTEKEINDAYDKKSETLDWGQAIAGETRHYLDWFYGINLSRALMSALKAVGKFKIMSIGRVQGPALNLIVEKEKQISAFKPQTYWQVFITLEKPKIELVHNDIFNKSELAKFKDIVGKKGEAETKSSEQLLPPNPPFNLTSLQTETYAFYGINPARTLQLAQSLYLSGLISYPRTSSQKLPPSINYKEILENLSEKYKVQKLITREKPIEGKKTDPAHPSIYPTGNFQELGTDEKKVYELIVKRFLSLFMDDAIVENKTIKVDINGLAFVKRGSSVKKKSWLQIYPRIIKETDLPDVNGEVKITDSRTEEKETQPPRRFSPASLVSELEKRNLGTKATRASILETLYDRGYIQGQSIKATPLGISLIETLEKHSPIIIDEALTRNFENEMNAIQTTKKGQIEKEEKVIEEAKNTIRKISEQFKEKEKEIGEELAGANTKLWEQQKEENKVGLCPVCKKGQLRITYSQKTRRFFISCSSYPECRNTYSLPPNSLIKKADKLCESCGFPMLMSIRKGKRPWIFCFNQNCEKNKERIEAYKKKQAEQNNNP